MPRLQPHPSPTPVGPHQKAPKANEIAVRGRRRRAAKKQTGCTVVPFLSQGGQAGRVGVAAGRSMWWWWSVLCHECRGAR